VIRPRCFSLAPPPARSLSAYSASSVCSLSRIFPSLFRILLPDFILTSPFSPVPLRNPLLDSVCFFIRFLPFGLWFLDDCIREIPTGYTDIYEGVEAGLYSDMLEMLCRIVSRVLGLSFGYMLGGMVMVG
jgi:hypothetical protein